MFGKRKREGWIWRCFLCSRVIRFNVDMLCDGCKCDRDLS